MQYPTATVRWATQAGGITMKVAKPNVKVVAVESSLVGRMARPRFDAQNDPHGGCVHLWPFATDMKHGGERVIDYREKSAEIVAVYIGELNDGGTLKLALLGPTTGELHFVFATNVRIGGTDSQ